MPSEKISVGSHDSGTNSGMWRATPSSKEDDDMDRYYSADKYESQVGRTNSYQSSTNSISSAYEKSRSDSAPFMPQQQVSSGNSSNWTGPGQKSAAPPPNTSPVDSHRKRSTFSGASPSGLISKPYSGKEESSNPTLSEPISPLKLSRENEPKLMSNYRDELLHTAPQSHSSSHSRSRSAGRWRKEVEQAFTSATGKGMDIAIPTGTTGSSGVNSTSEIPNRRPSEYNSYLGSKDDSDELAGGYDTT
jgi:hypothetical protein